VSEFMDEGKANLFADCGIIRAPRLAWVGKQKSSKIVC
jgi:hypothetical protein